MIEENGTVLEVSNDYALVETRRASACGQCSMNKGCGTATLAKMFGAKRTRVRALNPVSARAGDQVVLGLAEEALVKGSLAVYAVPLLALLLGAVLGETIGAGLGLNSNDVLAIAGGAGGLMLGLWWLRLFSRTIRHSEKYQPVITAIRQGAEPLVQAPSRSLAD
jgi:sigma-E factor negative regulatory protein RseC